MNELIDTKLVAKLMNEVAKECGMTRDDSCNVSQTLWWAKEVQMIDLGAILPINDNYRYITKTYDFVADNFLELLAKRVEAEGFDLADNEPKVTTSKSMWSDWGNKHYEETDKKHWKYRDKICEKLWKEHNIKPKDDIYVNDGKAGELLRKANDIADKEMPLSNIEDYPKVRGKLYGSQYIRMIVAWKGQGSDEWREKESMDPVDKKWYLEKIEFIKNFKRKGERYVR